MGREQTPTASERGSRDRPRAFHGRERASTVCARTPRARHGALINQHRPPIRGPRASPEVHRTSTERERTLAFDAPALTRARPALTGAQTALTRAHPALTGAHPALTAGQRPQRVRSLTLSVGELTSTVSHRPPTSWKPASIDGSRISTVWQRAPTFRQRTPICWQRTPTLRRRTPSSWNPARTVSTAGPSEAVAPRRFRGWQMPCGNRRSSSLARSRPSRTAPARS